MKHLLAQRRSLRNVVGLPRPFLQLLVVQVTRGQILQHVTQMEDADRVVKIAPKNDEPGVLTVFELFFDMVPVVFQVNPVDFVAGDHDVVDRYFLEIENADKHLLVAPRQQNARLQDHAA